MLIIPSSLVRLVGGPRPRKYVNRRRTAGTAGMKGRVPHALKLPLGLYAALDTVPPSRTGSTAAYRSRRCHQYADALYQNMTPDQKRLWADARKKSGISAYDLWMKEALTLLNQAKCPPDTPSTSGGYSTRNVLEGDTHWPAPCWGGPGLGSMYYRPIPPYDNPDWQPYRLRWQSAPVSPPNTLSDPLVYVAAWQPDEQTWRWGPAQISLDDPQELTHHRSDLPYCYWQYGYHNALAPPDHIRWYKGQCIARHTWTADCPEQPKWPPPPQRTYPLPFSP